jgi:uncharacterized Zn finger protein
MLMKIKYPAYICKDCGNCFYDEIEEEFEHAYALECDECGELAEWAGFKDVIRNDDKKWMDYIK